MKKKLLALLMASAMVLGLAACGNSGSAGGSTGAATGGSSAGSTASTDASAIDTSEHVVITYMTTGGKPTNGATEEMLAQLNAILTEKVNAELEIYYIDWTNYLSVYNLTLAQMDGSVDLVGTATDWLDAWPNAKNGAFLELSEDMLKTYAPKTWASVSPEHWDLCKYNGNIYLMPEDNYAQWTNHGFAYRLDWAKEAGLADGVKSWEDLTTYFKWVKANKPDLKAVWDSDGTQYAQMVGGWITSHSNYVSIDGLNSGAMWGGTKDDLYTIYSPYVTDTDSLVAYAKMMKEWDEIGVWPTDVLNNTASTNRDDFRVGLVAAEQHHTQTWTDLCSATSSNTMYQDDPNAETGFFYFGEESKNVVALSITHGAMAISAASKHPERALMVYDLLRNDEQCYRLLNYGIQGKQWDMDSNGMRITPASYNSDTDAITTNYWWGRNDDLEVRSAELNWPAIDELYKEYDAIKIDYPYGQFIPNVDSIQAKIDNISEIHTNYMKQISFGKYSGSAEEIVAEYQQALKDAGIDEVTAELQAQVDALYK
ncbi:MAG: extracellular solute-binding protein [Lachnospiraceae bacterium]|nr:extracellular solute-binding protein [Lachnospiraceae bacterium]